MGRKGMKGGWRANRQTERTKGALMKSDNDDNDDDGKG
jgi:hypothetical protein